MILRISHGYEVKEHNDPFVEIADRATEQFSLATAPGGFLVDLIPASVYFNDCRFKLLTCMTEVRYIPLWFPGASFRRKANEWAETLQEMVDRPYAFVKQQMV